jgi:hypothetical protein
MTDAVQTVPAKPTPSKGGIDPRVWTYVGVALLVAGCVLVVVAWGLTAGKTQVGLQIPYLLSAGFPGVGLAVVGTGLVVLGSREADAQARRHQQLELVSLLTVLRDELNAEPVPPPSAPARPRRTRKAAE